MLPGARLVFTQGLTFSPNSTAFFATNPAAIITFGLEVFVQLVIAAITISPDLISLFNLFVTLLVWFLNLIDSGNFLIKTLS